MPKAIIVQFVGQTNTKPSRWKCKSNGIKASYISREECETPEEACAKFAENNGWANRIWVGGGMPKEGNHAFVQCLVETAEGCVCTECYAPMVRSPRWKNKDECICLVCGEHWKN